MTKNVKPEGYSTATPFLVLDDTAKAIDFYKRALGAEELFRMPGPAGKGIVHAQVKIGDSTLMLGDECPVAGTKSPRSLGGTASSIYLYVSDVDSAFKSALKAGAKEKLGVQDMYWGDRIGRLADPFGHEWTLATHKLDLSPEEIAKRAQAFFASMAATSV
ncbi:VOC family protein [bacterium]|nr:VOC family protein [bacterium]